MVLEPVSEVMRQYGRIDKWLKAPIEGKFLYVFLDGLWLKRYWAGEVKNVSVVVAIGVDRHGYRQVLGIEEGTKEDKESWVIIPTVKCV